MTNETMKINELGKATLAKAVSNNLLNLLKVEFTPQQHPSATDPVDFFLAPSEN